MRIILIFLGNADENENHPHLAQENANENHPHLAQDANNSHPRLGNPAPVPICRAAFPLYCRRAVPIARLAVS